jgi:ATP-dependent Clp protease ATP-binding subunit ClpA
VYYRTDFLNLFPIDIYLNPDLAQVIEHSLKITEYLKDDFVATEHLFIAMLDVTSETRDLLLKHKIQKENVLKIHKSE